MRQHIVVLLLAILLGIFVPTITGQTNPKASLAMSQSEGTVCGEAKTCNDAFDAAIENCKEEGGTKWNILGPCTDTSDGKKRQCVTCVIPKKQSAVSPTPSKTDASSPKPKVYMGSAGCLKNSNFKPGL